MARAGWNLPNAKVNLQYVGSDTVCVMKRFFVFLLYFSAENKNQCVLYCKLN